MKWSSLSDGEEALDYLYCRGKYQARGGDNPAVMLLDLKLPKVDGLEVLQQVKSDDKLKIDSRGGAHLVPGRKGHGGKLQAGRERLCSEARRLPRVCECHPGTGRFLGSDQRAAAGKREKVTMRPPLRILSLEDDPRDAELVQETLESDGITLPDNAG